MTKGVGEQISKETLDQGFICLDRGDMIFDFQGRVLSLQIVQQHVHGNILAANASLSEISHNQQFICCFSKGSCLLDQLIFRKDSVFFSQNACAQILRIALNYGQGIAQFMGYLTDG